MHPNAFKGSVVIRAGALGFSFAIDNTWLWSMELLDACEGERSESYLNLDIHNKPAEVSRLSDISVAQLFFKHKWFQFNTSLCVGLYVYVPVHTSTHIRTVCVRSHVYNTH